MPFQNTGIAEAYKWPSHGLTQGPNRGELQTAAVDGKIHNVLRYIPTARTKLTPKPFVSNSTMTNENTTNTPSRLSHCDSLRKHPNFLTVFFPP